MSLNQVSVKAGENPFVEDARKVRSALEACEQFLDSLKKARVENVTERREELAESLRGAQHYIARILSHLEGGDDPQIGEAEKEDDE